MGTNYFFEIAKIRALRILFNTLASEYNYNFDCHIIATPTKRNKTIYDYNVNMLRTTTECMSAILGGANAVSNLAYDAIYHKDNEFGDRISRNQLLILKEILLGTNKYPNPNESMKHDLELFPFVKTKDRKTLIVPIIEKRLADKVEQERLALEE